MLRRFEEAHFRYRGGLLRGAGALFYCQLAYFGGVALILSLNPVLMAVGTFAMAHGMVIASYMIHECAHNALFKLPGYNARMGSMLSWLTGACYGTFMDLRAKHLRHHVDNIDAAAFDYRGYLARHPVQLKIVEILEWLYVPAVELIMHGVLVAAPFIFEEKKKQRPRTTGVVAARFGLLFMLFLHAPAAYACYLLACAVFLTILRFMDALQHSYELVMPSADSLDGAKRRGDKNYEQSHTFSNPVSVNHPWLNLVTLNFGYHNAHHARPTAPWHELPKLHGELYGREAACVIPFWRQLSSFHRSRVTRVLGDNSETEGSRFARRLENGSAVGASGVSFLTPF
ncbi:MAG: fatty acid desaturase [Nitrosospira sp.]|nr:fatty acid desaturase [Nitrosospira sp.]